MPAIDKAIDFQELLDRSTLLINELGWSPEEGKKFLLEKFQKKSRHQLNDAEFVEFVAVLEKLVSQKFEIPF
jgi:hypothetical protein